MNPRMKVHKDSDPNDLSILIELTDFKKSNSNQQEFQVQKQVTIPLYYLKDFNEKELSAFEKNYKKTRYELEALIKDYYKRYYYEYTHLLADTGSNVLWIYYNILTSQSEVKAFANVIHSTKISDSLANAIGITLATTGSMPFIFYSTPSKRAAIATMAHATADPLLEKIRDFMSALQRQPVEVMKALSASLVHTTLIGTTYFTVGVTEAIPLINIINQHINLPAKWLIVAGIEYFACRYMNVFQTQAYFNGIKFWKNEDNKDYLAQRILKGEIAIPLQVLFQGIVSAVGLRGISYYNMATTASSALGGFIPPILVGALAAIHGLSALYPTTYNYYLGSEEKITEILRRSLDINEIEKIFYEYMQSSTLINDEVSDENSKKLIIIKILEKQISQLNERVHSEFNTNEIYLRVNKIFPHKYIFSFNKIKQQQYIADIISAIIKAEKIILQTKNKKQLGYFGLYKQEPWSMINISWQGGIGAYFGGYFIAPLIMTNPPLALTLSTAAVGAGLFASFAHRVEANRTVNNLTLKELEIEEDEKQHPNEKNKALEAAAHVTAAGLVTIYAASSIVSAVGSPCIFGGSSPLCTSFTATTATQSGLNSINYMYPAVSKTLTTFFLGIADTVKNLPSCCKSKKVDDTGQNVSLLSSQPRIIDNYFESDVQNLSGSNPSSAFKEEVRMFFSRTGRDDKLQKYEGHTPRNKR